MFLNSSGYTQPTESVRTRKKGLIDHENALSAECFNWLDNAITAYYRNRIFAILNQIETHPHHVVLKQWEELLTDMHGDEQDPKNEIFKVILNDPKINLKIKNWLDEYMLGIHNSK